MVVVERCCLWLFVVVWCCVLLSVAVWCCVLLVAINCYLLVFVIVTRRWLFVVG